MCEVRLGKHLLGTSLHTTIFWREKNYNSQKRHLTDLTRRKIARQTSDCTSLALHIMVTIKCYREIKEVLARSTLYLTLSSAENSLRNYSATYRSKRDGDSAISS